MKRFSGACCALLATVPTMALAGHDTHLTAPVGVMGDHTHEQGNWMFSYRYSSMAMSDNRDGSNELSDAEVLSNFMVTPTSMDMQMHMFSAMYGLNDRITLMAMGSYIDKEMDHLTRMGMRFTTRSEGFGDTQLGATYLLAGNGHHGDHPICHEPPASHQLYFNAALSVPTGSIDERDDTPAASNAVLPYPMQLGSGTVDPVLGLTYSGAKGGFGWGAQAKATLRLYDNSEDYHLGNLYQMNLWGSTQVAPSWQLSARLEGAYRENISGADSRLNPMMVPTADPERQARFSVDGLVGAAYTPEALPDNRFAIELGRPIYQSFDGPQLETDWRMQFGWQWIF